MVSREPFHIDPEVDGLLREIAADPNSCLFKSSRPRNPMSWAEYTEPLSTWTPDLTKAEKHLVQVHRVEVATLLKARWSIEIAERPPERVHIETRVEPGIRAKLFERADWHEQAQEQLTLSDRSTEGLSLLERMMDPAALDSESQTQLVSVAMRLSPSNNSRVFMAEDMIRRGDLRSAHAAHCMVLRSDPAGELRSFAWEGLAHIRSLRGSLQGARELYQRSAEHFQSRLMPLTSWILLAAQTGDQEGVKHATGMVEALGPSAASRVESLAFAQERTRALGIWRPTQAGIRIAHLLEDRVGPMSRRVLHVLL